MARKSALSLVSPSTGIAQSGLSRTSVVYERLRQDLLHGDLKAGEKLAVASLSMRYAFGASPVREALSRLSAEGLVEQIDQRGFRAAALDFSELPVLTQTRCELESLAHTKHGVAVQVRVFWVKQPGHQRLVSRSFDNDMKVRGLPV